MAVLRINAPNRQSCATSGATRRRPHRTNRKLVTLIELLTAPLPADVSPQEYTVAALFRTSQALNFVTGGRAEMTFSARGHAGRIADRCRIRRIAWHLSAGLIDAVCGVLLGECKHCAAAWSNYRARRRDVHS